MRKLMLLAAMLAMVLAAAVPALAQSVTQVGSGNQACVQTAVQAEVGKVQISQYGDNVNIQNIAQECNVNVAQVEEAVASASASSAPTASATAAPTAKKVAKPTATAKKTAPVRDNGRHPAHKRFAALPPTGGTGLPALGAGALLVVSGLLARRALR